MHTQTFFFDNFPVPCPFIDQPIIYWMYFHFQNNRRRNIRHIECSKKLSKCWVLFDSNKAKITTNPMIILIFVFVTHDKKNVNNSPQTHNKTSAVLCKSNEINWTKKRATEKKIQREKKSIFFIYQISSKLERRKRKKNNQLRLSVSIVFHKRLFIWIFASLRTIFYGKHLNQNQMLVSSKINEARYRFLFYTN